MIREGGVLIPSRGWPLEGAAHGETGGGASVPKLEGGTRSVVAT